MGRVGRSDDVDEIQGKVSTLGRPVQDSGAVTVVDSPCPLRPFWACCPASWAAWLLQGRAVDVGVSFERKGREAEGLQL